MSEAIKVERELEDIRRKMMACMHEMGDFVRRVKVAKLPVVDYRAPGSLAQGEAICKMVAGHFGMTTERMISRDRQGSVIIARQLSQYIMRQVTTLSYPVIGELTGIRDHTTVMHSMRKIEAMRHSNADFDAKVRMLLGRALAENEGDVTQ